MHYVSISLNRSKVLMKTSFVQIKYQINVPVNNDIIPFIANCFNQPYLLIANQTMLLFSRTIISNEINHLLCRCWLICQPRSTDSHSLSACVFVYFSIIHSRTERWYPHFCVQFMAMRVFKCAQMKATSFKHTEQSWQTNGNLISEHVMFLNHKMPHSSTGRL